MGLIKAIRKGSTAQFSEAVWKTGQPQRAGWIEMGAPPLDPEKVLPLALVQFAEIRQQRKPPEPKPVADVKTPIVEAAEKGELVKKRTTKPRAKKGAKK